MWEYGNVSQCLIFEDRDPIDVVVDTRIVGRYTSDRVVICIRQSTALYTQIKQGLLTFFLLFDCSWPTFDAQEIAKRHGAAVYVLIHSSDVSV